MTEVKMLQSIFFIFEKKLDLYCTIRLLYNKIIFSKYFLKLSKKKNRGK